MPAITLIDLENAKTDVDHLAAIANSTALTATDRLGRTKQTIAGLSAEFPNASANAAAAAASAVDAAEAAQIAQDEAVVAIANSAAAQTARTGAEAARDAAQLSAGVYATTAAGLAATTSGRYFSVPSADSAEYLILYLNNAGAAVEQKRYPSIAAMTAQARAIAHVYDQPNLFTLEQLSFSDLTLFGRSSVAVLAVEVVNNARTLKVSNGSMTADFPASSFVETGKISASLWAERLSGSTSFSRFRVTQLNAEGASLGYTETYFGADFTAAKFFSVKNISIIVGCVTVRVTVQTSASAGGDIWVRDLMIAQGSSAEFRAPSPSSIQDSMIASKDIFTGADLTIVASSNLAKPEYLLNDVYVNNSGSLTNAAGWKTYRIPVSPNTQYTFGGFSIDTAGYSSFLASDNSVLQYNGSYTTGTLPKTYTSPAGTSFLHVTVARPINVPADYAQAIINVGATLLPYENPRDTVTAIGGKALAGSVDPAGYARLGFNANFAGLTADTLTVGALMANLPSGATVPAGVEVNQAWINTADSTIRVRLA